MSSLMIRISEDNKAYLQVLPKKRGKSMTRVIEDMLEEHRRLSFFQDLNSGYARLKADPKCLQEEQTEASLWDQTSVDGLGDE